MFEFIFTVFRVIESFMDGTVKEQRLRTKNVNAKKVNTAKTQANRSCKNLLTQFSHVLHSPRADDEFGEGILGNQKFKKCTI
jgi:hypothetical protein